MKTIKLLCCLFLVQHVYALPVFPLLDGYWRGAVSRDGSVQLIEINFARLGDSLKASYNLPDLGMYEEPALLTAVTDSSFSIKTFMGLFDVIINEQHQEITGINNNWKPVPLKFHAKKMIAPMADYQKEEIAITIADVVIKGSLFKPLGHKKFPLVIIAHGADNPTRTNWVYRYYAYLLVKYGFGVFIYDQRGTGASGGKHDAIMNDHADDLVKIGKHFSQKEYIDAKKMSIIGESRGGWIAPLAAARSTYFKTLILIQGSPKSPIELEYDVIRTALRDQEFSKPQVDSAIAFAHLYFRTTKDSSLWPQLSDTWKQVKSRTWAAQLPKPGKLNDEDMLWWKKNDFEPAPYLKNRSASILAIYGTADKFVPAKENAPLMENYLSSSNKNYMVLTIQGLPHGLYYYQSLYGNEYSWPEHFWIWPKRSVEMDTVIVDWLKKML